MYSAIKLELVADDFFWHENHGGLPFQEWLRYMRKLGPDKSNTWVAKIEMPGARKFVYGIPDYTNANETGSRGVERWYTLEPGVYEINHRYKLGKVRRYFGISENGIFRECSKQEALLWLKNTLG